VHAWILYVREPGDLISILQRANALKDRSGKVCGRNPDMHADEKSDIVIVPEKASNNGAQATAETLEERTMTEGNSEKPVCDLYTVTGVNNVPVFRNT
jgi:hypothetical protein